MSDYNFKYTSSPLTNDSFVVKPYTANGPANPTSTALYHNAVTGAYALSANTPFVLVGKGVVDYGQVVQNNIIYLAENFYARSRPIPPLKGMLWYKSEHYIDPQYPLDPTDAGLYVWNGTSWKSVLVNGTSQTSFDANHQRIINVADAITSTDAITEQFANTRYLQLTGGTVVGDVIIASGSNLTLITNPTASDHATNKQYVDNADAILQSNITSTTNTLTNDIAVTNARFDEYLPLAGGTLTGNVETNSRISIGADGSLVLESGGTGFFDVGMRRIQNVGDVIAAYDATNKAYVDNTIAAAIAGIDTTSTPPDGVVDGGSFDSASGTITLTRSMGLSDIAIAGQLAAKTHFHDSNDVKYNIHTNQGQGIMNSLAVELGIDPVNTSVSSALTILDQAAYFSQLDPVREILVGDGVATTFTLDDKHAYEVWSERLSIHINGVKQYGDTRSHAEITIEDAVNGLGLNSVLELAPGTYSQSFTIDGVDHTTSVLVAAGDTYWDLIVRLAAAIQTDAIPVGLLMEQLYTGIWLSFVSLNTGPTHSVTISMTPGQLFESISYSTAPSSAVGALYGYEEVGVPGDTSTSVTFHTAPPSGSLIEFIVHR